MVAKKQNILIIGAGAGGVSAAQGLSKALDPSLFTIQLVSDRPYFVHWPAMLRVVVTDDGGLGEKAILPLDHVFQPGRAGEVVIGTVQSVEDGVAHLADGRDLYYDYLVLATGTHWTGPLVFPNDVEKKDAWISAWRKKFSEARDVVIIGAGAAGIELAGELRHYYPRTNVTLIHAQHLPLNDAYPHKFRTYAATKVRNAGINLILNDRASMPEGPYTSIVTESGRKIDADLVIPMWGGKINTDFLRSFDPTIFTPQGTVNVLPSLRVPLANGKTNVYAIGDIFEWKEQKNLAKIPTQAGILVPNIVASINGQPAPKAYKGFMDAVVIPLGPRGGFGYLPILWGICIGDWLTWMLKSKTLFVAQAGKLLGY